MIIGTYFLIAIILVGRKINEPAWDGFDFDRDSQCCDRKMFLPDWLVLHITFMIKRDMGGKLGVHVLGAFISYLLMIFLVNWLFGLVFLRNPSEPGKTFGYGLAIYLIFEMIVGFIIVMYSLIKSILRTVEDVKLSERMAMQDLEEDGQPITQKTKLERMVEHILESPEL